MSNLLKQVAEPQNQDTTFIYGLVDPRTGYVRYVGKANNPTYRLSMHLTPAEIKDTSHKNSWLRGLLSDGNKPELIILQSVSKSIWQDAERRWIAYYRSIPKYPRLTNTVDGGEGVDGLILSEQQRRARSERQKGKRMPLGHGEKIRKALTGFKHSAKSRENMSEGKKKQWDDASMEYRIARGIQLRSAITEETIKKIAEAGRNRKKLPSATSQYRGVRKIPKKNPWCACCTINGKNNHIGVFATEEEAARARDRFVLANFPGKTIALNFPHSDYQ